MLHLNFNFFNSLVGYVGKKISSFTNKVVCSFCVAANMLFGNPTVQKYVAAFWVGFYTVSDVMGMTSWSKKVVLRLFNDPDFPAAELGKAKVVEAHALIDYFSVRRSREDPDEGRNGELKNELKRRMQEKEAR